MSSGIQVINTADPASILTVQRGGRRPYAQDERPDRRRWHQPCASSPSSGTTPYWPDSTRPTPLMDQESAAGRLLGSIRCMRESPLRRKPRCEAVDEQSCLKRCQERVLVHLVADDTRPFVGARGSTTGPSGRAQRRSRHAGWRRGLGGVAPDRNHLGRLGVADLVCRASFNTVFLGRSIGRTHDEGGGVRILAPPPTEYSVLATPEPTWVADRVTVVCAGAHLPTPWRSPSWSWAEHRHSWSS